MVAIGEEKEKTRGERMVKSKKSSKGQNIKNEGGKARLSRLLPDPSPAFKVTGRNQRLDQGNLCVRD